MSFWLEFSLSLSFFKDIYNNLLAWHACGMARRPVGGSKAVRRRGVSVEIKEAVGPDHVLKALDFTVSELSNL